MGIVVTIFMFLGLLLLSPWPWLNPGKLSNNPKFINGVTLGLLFSGLWNLLWHGLQNLTSFWGVAALVSGLGFNSEVHRFNR